MAIHYRWTAARLTVWNTDTGVTTRLFAFKAAYYALRENSDLACLFALAPDRKLPWVSHYHAPDNPEHRVWYDRSSIREIEAGWLDGSTRTLSTTRH